MPARTHCVSCVQVLRRQHITPLPTLHRQALRLASTAAKKPSPKSKATSKLPPVTKPSTPRPTSAIKPTPSRDAAPQTPPPDEGVLKSGVTTLAKAVRKAAPSMTETYAAYGICEILVKECARVADYTLPQRFEKDAEIPKTDNGEDLGVGSGWWYEQLGLQPTFQNWAQITFLHMYLLTVRLRTFPADHAPTWHKQLTDHFFYLAEERMVVTHNISSRMMRNKYLKDLFTQFRGLTLAYDSGLIQGDAVLATAVWRNVCKADAEVDFTKLAEVVAFMRSSLVALDGLEDEVIATGDVVFGDPAEQMALVAQKSRLADSSKYQKATKEFSKLSATQKA